MKKLLPIIGTLFIIGLNINAFGQSAPVNKTTGDSATVNATYLNIIKRCTEAIKSGTLNNAQLAAMHYQRSAAEIKLKDYDKCITDCTAAIALNPQIPGAYWNRGLGYEHNKNYQLAINDYNNALLYLSADKKSSAILYNNIAIIERDLKQYDKAIEDCSLAIVLNPDYAPAYDNRARVYSLTGKYQLAINDLSNAMYGYKDNAVALSKVFFQRANMKKALKQYKDAINDYSFAIKLMPDNKFAYWSRASVYYNDGDYQLANDDYNKAIAFFKDDKKSLSNLYDDRARMEQGQLLYNKAIEDDSLAIVLNPQFAVAYWNKADSHAQNGDFRLSIVDYKKTINFYQASKPQLAQLYVSIANNEYLLNEFQNSIDDCNTALSMDPQSWAPYLYRGRAYFKMNNKDLAMADFKNILAKDTSKKSVDYAFALYYTGAPDKAIEVMQNNIVGETNPYFLLVYYYNTACLLSLMNKPDEATGYIKKCMDAGYPKKYILADADMDNIRNTDGFKKIISGSKN
jgi:tetratricopeptide (TPR) repeat protein